MRRIEVAVEVEYADDDGCRDVCRFTLGLDADPALHGIVEPLHDPGEAALAHHVAEQVEVGFRESLEHRAAHAHRAEEGHDYVE